MFDCIFAAAYRSDSRAGLAYATVFADVTCLLKSTRP